MSEMDGYKECGGEHNTRIVERAMERNGRRRRRKNAFLS
jgi:hypothetical protein